MLKFNSWPPQAGEVEFTDSTLKILYCEGERMSINERFHIDDDKKVREIGVQVGIILAANIEQPSPLKELPSQSKVLEIAHQLVNGRMGHYEYSPFMEGVFSGAFSETDARAYFETLPGHE